MPINVPNRQSQTADAKRRRKVNRRIVGAIQLVILKLLKRRKQISADDVHAYREIPPEWMRFVAPLFRFGSRASEQSASLISNTECSENKNAVNQSNQLTATLTENKAAAFPEATQIRRVCQRLRSK